MALARWQATIVDDAGDVQPLASVEVRRDVAGQPLASLFSDRDGVSPISNPFLADADGFAALHVLGGAYKITATLGGFSRTWRYVPVGTAAENDIDGLTAEVGVQFGFNTGTTDADPGDGALRLNHAAPASATAAYIDNLGAGGATVSAWLDTFDDLGNTSNRGVLHIFSVSEPGANFRLYKVTGSVVDGTGYRKVTLAHIAGAGALAGFVNVVFYPTGVAGADGVTAGMRWNFDSSTTTAADPGTGDIRFNHASLASVTELSISDLNGSTGNPDSSAWVISWDDAGSSPYGTLYIKKSGAEENFAIFNVTAINDQSGYTRVTVAYIAGAGSFSAADALSVSFVKTGSAGTAATASDQETPVSGAVFVSPSVQQRHPSAVKASGRITYGGGVPSISMGYGVTSVGDQGTGQARINLATAFSAATYAPVACILNTSFLASCNIVSTSVFDIFTIAFSGGTLADASSAFEVCGDQ